MTDTPNTKTNPTGTAPAAELRQPGQTAGMTVMDHLQELRQRVQTSAAALAIGVLAGFWLSHDAINHLKTLVPPGVVFVQLTPGEVLMTSMKLAMMLGAALASPIMLYQGLRFVLPGLKPNEKGSVVLAVVCGSVLFVLGLGFAYTLAIPPALGFLMDYGQDVAVMQMSIASYVEFCLGLLLLIGLMFELPMVLFFLALTGLVSSKQLATHWRAAIVGTFLAAALLTPSQDPLTMLVVGGALMGLYLLSIIPIKLSGR